MSSVFGGGSKRPDVKREKPALKVETEDEETKRRRERKRLLTGGRESTRGFGIASALDRMLKRRFGE